MSAEPWAASLLRVLECATQTRPADRYQRVEDFWDEISDEPFAFPVGKDRILASYQSGTEKVAYVEPIAVGDVMKDMALFVSETMRVDVPLESTYQSAWATCPEAMQEAVETGVIPNPDAE